MPSKAPAPAPASAPQGRRLVLAAELLLVAAGALLRLRLASRYDPRNGYDFKPHLDYVSWIARHAELPPIAAFRTAYHPPLFYWLGGVLVRHGASVDQLQGISIAAGIASLALLFVGLRRHVGDASARLFALALAGVLPVSLQLDGMVSNEPLNRLLGTLALVLLPWALDASRPHAALRGAALGVVLALGLLAKISGLAIVLTVALGAVLALRGPGRAAVRIQRAIAPALACAIAMAALLPLQLRALRETGHVVASGFDGAPWGRARLAQLAHTRYFSRRPLGFVAGLGQGAALRKPWVARGARPDPHFWPVLVASTFADYYDFEFCRRPPPGEPAAEVTMHGALSQRTVELMRGSVAGGIVLALLVLAALPGALVAAARRRERGPLLLLVAPIVAVLLQLHFAIAFPYDDQGPVKGLYLQFAAAPLFALAGAGFGWLWRRGRLRVLAVIPLAALAAVAGYSLHALDLLPA